ncbi:MAG: OmpA family protein [Proteobacteria bacterium]|nr:OmpA family protein [Pseudomonadota bacterium]MBU1688316.1 OmpA family protein [Pseudomonadota bacterium]
MSKKNLSGKRFIKIVIMVGALLAIGVEMAMAADCDALFDSVQKQPSLMTKKGMIEDALKSCPKHAGLVYQYGYAYERFRKYDEALKYYNQAIKLDHNYAKAYFGIGDVQVLLNRYKEAIDAYQTGLLYDPDDGRAKNSLNEAKAQYKAESGSEYAGTTPQKKVEAPSSPASVQVSKVKPESPPSFAEVPILRLIVPFAGNATNLSQDAKDVLAVVVGQAMAKGDLAGSRFEVGGYTDNTGDAAQNKEISKQRVEAVRDYLINDFGIQADRLVGVYYGEKSPRFPNDTQENQALNRRVEFKRIQ